MEAQYVAHIAFDRGPLPFPLPAYAWPGTVLDVHDGDRMIVAPMGDVRTPLKIRLYGIDAPELEQKGGPQS